MFTFFTTLADAYSKILMPSKALDERLRKDVDKAVVLDRCLKRLEWERSQERCELPSRWPAQPFSLIPAEPAARRRRRRRRSGRLWRARSAATPTSTLTHFAGCGGLARLCDRGDD